MTSISTNGRSVGDCAMCGSVAAPASEWDRPILASSHFVVMPSLGSLVEGWLLIVPRVHVISLGALSSELAMEFADLKDRVWDVLELTYGCVVAFEHGPAAPNAAAGCGVDHAHMHLVPFRLDLAQAAAPYVAAETVWSHANWADCQRAHLAGVDYLYVEQRKGSGQIAVGERFGGQIFRQVIARAIGRPAEYNWRTHPQTETIARTIKRFEPLDLERCSRTS
ncbi:MAG: hypothetical protein OXH69_13310 [Acidobacteria bacterium]|nr:hypothetical protein [Acidobacteriota bacterium]